MNCARLGGIVLALCICVNAGKRGLRQRQGEGHLKPTNPPSQNPPPVHPAGRSDTVLGSVRLRKLTRKKRQGNWLVIYDRDEHLESSKPPQYNQIAMKSLNSRAAGVDAFASMGTSGTHIQNLARGMRNVLGWPTGTAEMSFIELETNRGAKKHLTQFLDS